MVQNINLVNYFQNGLYFGIWQKEHQRAVRLGLGWGERWEAQFSSQGDSSQRVEAWDSAGVASAFQACPGAAVAVDISTFLLPGGEFFLSLYQFSNRWETWTSLLHNFFCSMSVWIFRCLFRIWFLFGPSFTNLDITFNRPRRLTVWPHDLTYAWTSVKMTLVFRRKVFGTLQFIYWSLNPPPWPCLEMGTVRLDDKD